MIMLRPSHTLVTLLGFLLLLPARAEAALPTAKADPAVRAPTITLVIPETVDGQRQVPVNQNDEFTIEVHVDDVTNLLGVSFDLTWSAAGNLEHVSNTEGAFINVGGLLYLATPSAGGVNFGISRPVSAGGVSGAGVVARIRLRMRAATGVATALSLTNVSALDAGGASITMTALNQVISTDTEDEAAVPSAFTVHGAYPNPFNPTTTVVFDLDEPAEVGLQLIDPLGRLRYEVASRRLEAGAGQQLQVDAAGLASGLYLYRVVARTATAVHARTGRVTLLK